MTDVDTDDVMDYADFLPPEYTEEIPVPVSTWWPWRGRRIHVARHPEPRSAVRVMVIHGGGGYSGALWPAASVAATAGIELLAPDLPLYGYTEEPDPASVRYDDWIEVLCDLVEAERDADPRPLILFGASMGGMLAYEVAARTGRVDAIVATCLLDMADPAARAAACRFSWLGRPGPAVLRFFDRFAGRLRLPIRWLADMANMSQDPRLSEVCASDPRGGGVRVPLGFLSSWMNHESTPPETFAATPVTLVAPADDAWTPPQLSVDFLDRIAAPREVVVLENCGHFPIEEPGLSQLKAATLRVIDRVTQGQVQGQTKERRNTGTARPARFS